MPVFASNRINPDQPYPGYQSPVHAGIKIGDIKAGFNRLPCHTARLCNGCIGECRRIAGNPVAVCDGHPQVTAVSAALHLSVVRSVKPASFAGTVIELSDDGLGMVLDVSGPRVRQWRLFWTSDDGGCQSPPGSRPGAAGSSTARSMPGGSASP